MNYPDTERNKTIDNMLEILEKLRKKAPDEERLKKVDEMIDLLIKMKDKAAVSELNDESNSKIK